MNDIDKVKEVMSGLFKISKADIPDDAELGKVSGWDSLGHVSFLMALGKEFSFDVNPGTLTELTSLPSILAFIENQD